MKKRILLAGTVCALALSGCQGGSVSNLLPGSKEAVETETETVEETAPAWEESDELELYNSYINVYNFAADRLADSVTRYFKYVEYQEEFALVEGKTDYDNYSIGDHQKEGVEKTYQLLEEKAEKNKLDEAFLQMYPSITKLIDCLNDIYDYTDMKSYLDDDYAKGKEMHSVLWSSMNEYTAAMEGFETELLVAEKEQREKSLQRMQEEGMEALYTINIMIDSAKAVQAELYDQEVFDNNILDMNMEKIQPLYDEFIKNVDMVLEVCSDEAKLSEEGIPIHSAYWSTFLGNMKDTKKSLTSVIQKVKEQTPLTSSDTLINMPGNCSLASYDAGISKMVSDYNHIIDY